MTQKYTEEQNWETHTIEEAAEKLKMTPRMVQSRLKSGKLQGFKDGRDWRYAWEKAWRPGLSVIW